MIFVTVGGQTPFERLVRAVDDWAAKNNRDDVFAQIGRSEHEPRAIAFLRFLPADEFRRRVEQADVVVAHAGMGTIITALELKRPLLVMPRRAHLSETRTDHQLATALRVAQSHGVAVAHDEKDLASWLDRLEAIPAGAGISEARAAGLLQAIRHFLASP